MESLQRVMIKDRYSVILPVLFGVKSNAWQVSHRGAPERVLMGKNKGFVLLGYIPFVHV
jgi:hypothetical protein